MASSSSPPRKTAQMHVVPAIAAWVVPGLGHILLGQRKRGGIILAGMMTLWLSGLLMGGITSIDFRNRENRIVAILQMPFAGNWAVDRLHRRLETQAGGVPRPKTSPLDPEPAYEPSYGRMNEAGGLFAAVVGMLNLLAVIDVFYRDPDDPRRD